MGQSIKGIKDRIRSVEKIHKVTSAMQTISVVKYSRTEKELLPLRLYFLKLEEVLNNLFLSNESLSNPYLSDKSTGKKTCLCIIVSDSGLCGKYNDNILEAGSEFIKKTGEDTMQLVLVGKKAATYFKNNGSIKVLRSYAGLNGRYSPQIGNEIAQFLTDIFLSGQAGCVYAGYTHFKNALTLEPKIERFLPLKTKSPGKTEYLLCEPDINNILREIIPKYLNTKLRLLFMEAFTAEHAGRAVAMKTATENAKEMLAGLVLLRNKVRQANITQEITEVISSVEALKG
ncbi:MAG: ATP synthase F1 subunit gamma [Candidatus Omnitrophota bacterium]